MHSLCAGGQLNAQNRTTLTVWVCSAAAAWQLQRSALSEYPVGLMQGPCVVGVHIHYNIQSFHETQKAALRALIPRPRQQHMVVAKMPWYT